MKYDRNRIWSILKKNCRYTDIYYIEDYPCYRLELVGNDVQRCESGNYPIMDEIEKQLSLRCRNIENNSS